MTFRREHINEIPLSWQPKRYQKAVAHLGVHVKDIGYFPTGVRGIESGFRDKVEVVIYLRRGRYVQAYYARTIYLYMEPYTQ